VPPAPAMPFSNGAVIEQPNGQTIFVSPFTTGNGTAVGTPRPGMVAPPSAPPGPRVVPQAGQPAPPQNH
jgi:hypothetical protein